MKPKDCIGSILTLFRTGEVLLIDVKKIRKVKIELYSNWYYLLLLAFAGNSFVFLILDNISTSVWLWIQVSSGQRGQFLVHHGCSSEPLGPHPPRFTTLFPVLS